MRYHRSTTALRTRVCHQRPAISSKKAFRRDAWAKKSPTPRLRWTVCSTLHSFEMRPDWTSSAATESFRTRMLTGRQSLSVQLRLESNFSAPRLRRRPQTPQRKSRTLKSVRLLRRRRSSAKRSATQCNVRVASLELRPPRGRQAQGSGSVQRG